MKQLIFDFFVFSFAKREAAEKRVWRENRIVWQRLELEVMKYAVPDGDREVAGQPFRYAFRMPGGVWDGECPSIGMAAGNWKTTELD